MISPAASDLDSFDALAEAARAVPARAYLGPYGDAVLPVVPPHATVRDLRDLGLRPGMRVLEVGTGSGYSAALMGHVVGRRGHVLTIDEDEDMARRAGALFAEHGHHAVAAVGDGLLGHPGRAPYDRIYVRATPEAVPATWLDQLAPGGALITGCLVSDLPGAFAVAHIVKRPGGPQVTVHAGRCAPMGVLDTPTTVTVARAPDNRGHYLATSNPDGAMAAELLAILRTGHAEPWPGTPGEFLDLKNWLLAVRPHGLVTAVTEVGEGIGLGVVHDGRPEVALITAAHFVARPVTSPTARRLADLMNAWRTDGNPATDELDAVLLREGAAYRVRLDD